MMSRKKFTLLVFVLGVVSTLVFIFYAKIANAAVANPRFLNKVYIKWNGDDYVDVNPYDDTYKYEKGSTDCRDTIEVTDFGTTNPKAEITTMTSKTTQDGRDTCTKDLVLSKKNQKMDGVKDRKILGYKTSGDTIVLIAGAKKRTDSGGTPDSSCEVRGIDIINGKPVPHTYVYPPKDERTRKNRYKQLKDGATVGATDSLEKYIYVDLDDNDSSKGTLKTITVYFNFAHYDVKVGDIVFANDGKITPLPDEIASVAQTNGSTTVDPGDALKCEIRLTNPLTWFVCPMIDTARELVNSLNDAINEMLTLPTDKLFVTTNDVANQFYASWSGFRYIAMGLLVIIALIMVLSQAIGVGPFDAYTIRKVLPRLLAAVVLVSLSWPLMKLAVDITNGIGHSVSGLIYKPFYDQLQPGNPSNGFMGAVFTGVIASGFVFGLVGLLAFVATAALSLLSGMATLIFREMLIMFLVVVAPVAIICSILPNTQIVWKKWSDYFLRALIVFPIFSGVIAIGQVFAVIGPTLHTGAVGDLIQFIGYFGPYFMLPKIFAMSGGAMAAAGAVAQKATAGMRGGLKNFSQNRRKQIHEKRMDATSRLGGGRAGGAYRRLIAGGRNGSWQRGSQRWIDQEQLIKDNSATKRLEQGGARAFNDDDASSLARDATMTSRRFIREYRGLGHTEEEARRALARAESSTGAKMGSDAMAVAAQKFRVSGTNTAYGAGPAGLAVMQTELGEMVGRGLITAPDAASWMKSNKGRADYSSNSFGQTLAFVNGGITARDQIQGAYAGADPRDVIGSHANGVESFAEQALINFRASVLTTDPREIDKAAADLANIHSILSSISPNKGNEFADTTLSQGARISGDRINPVTGAMETRELKIREFLDDARVNSNDHTDFHDRVREYSSAAAAAAGGGAATPPPATPPPAPSDVRLKKDIVYVGVNDSGIRLYRFKYLWSETEYVGVMAQEVLHTHPEAVYTDQWGYHRVDYGMLGIEFMTHETWKKEALETRRKTPERTPTTSE